MDATLLSDEQHKEALVLYYWQVQSILDIVNDDSISQDQKVDGVGAYAKSAKKYGQLITAHSARHISLDNLNYAKAADKAFVEYEDD
jgi:hypothetical protein